MTEKKLSSVTAEKLRFKIRSSCWLIAISIRGLFFPSHLLSQFMAVRAKMGGATCTTQEVGCQTERLAQHTKNTDA